MELTFLGTSCMVPTKDRNVSGIFLKYKSEGILFDCGEGTQRQMNIAGLKRTSVTKILISHWHGDHVSGIIGLLQTLGNETSGRNEGEKYTLRIYGPRETKKRIDNMLNTCIFENKLDLEVYEFDPKPGSVMTVLETPEFKIECARLNHGIPCIGYSFIEKERLNIDVGKQKKLGVRDGPHLRKLKNGENIVYKGKTVKASDMTYVVPSKKITYVADTEGCEEAVILAENADVLISESSFAATLQEKAEMRKHLSAKDAANIAEQAGVKKLILTHFSQRYKTVDELVEEARMHFEKTEGAFDFMKIKI